MICSTPISAICRQALVAFTVLFVTAPFLRAQEPVELLPLSKPVTLFNGENLAGWTFLTRQENVQTSDVWTVEDGVLKCKGRPSGYLQTQRWYRDYELNLQWRWPGNRGGNSGVLVHTTTPLLFYGWPKSMEVQLQKSRAGDFWVIGKGVDVRVENEASRRKKPQIGNQHTHRMIQRLEGNFEKPLGEWNAMKIICNGSDIKVFINDQLANHGTEMTITEGAVALQSEGAAIEFRNINLQPLTSASGEK